VGDNILHTDIAMPRDAEAAIIFAHGRWQRPLQPSKSFRR
jgi:hypothetical protein